MPINEAKLNEFMGKALGDMGAAASATMVLIGDKLGLYKAMAKSGAVTPARLAKLTKTSERYIREWLNNQAAGGYVTYHPPTDEYTLPDEQAFALAEEGSPAFIPGAFQVIKAMFMAQDKIANNFKTGKGMEWGDHHPELFEGTERFFRPSYLANLVQSWIPALADVEAKLKKGAKVADIGCGHGASTILMALAYPNSTFTGFDYHKKSILAAQKRAKATGISKRVTFAVADASKFPGKDYDLVCHFDCLHDMGDPLGAAKRVRQALAADGTWMIVEPNAADRHEENHNPIGRMFYAASTSLCVPTSLARKGPALGAQAGEARLGDIIKQAGFTHVRRATHTPFNMVLEARP
jgi:SAM-dependent methyltransferase